jgi:tRNA(fMet)-specific endonuclease VapC
MRGWITAIARIRPNTSEVSIYDRLLANLALFRGLTVLRFDGASEMLLKQLKRERLRIGTMDLKIAAIALTSKATLVTRNIADFRRVPGLLIVDWATDQEEA